ncbi:post-GPI attachment to proteins factor 2-like [Amphibalanus amphitrite]|uniref:post-GPI attachment to proteins factor 2-like n=1 Tax=Amphibalanus amphitrite TaxID=1232801 RepID=UPI001C91F0E4|nr:post-GPI attachment to proteins factor 2-like [Amphibalanus amphitrite]
MDKASLEQVSLRLSIRRLSTVVLTIPMGAMIACFVSAHIHHEDINHTWCPVYNFIPSVSAITGVSPERYLWRLCMSAHLVPRCLIAAVCYNHFTRLLGAVPAERRRRYDQLVRAGFWANVTELASLACCTYVSNKENYPVHEKAFSLFLFSCFVYMVVSLAAEREAFPAMTPSQRSSHRWKAFVAVLYVSLIIGLLYYFWKHRFYCEELAFTWFSFCEYGICACIMVYHLLVIYDIPEFWLTVGVPLPAAANGISAPLKVD